MVSRLHIRYAGEFPTNVVREVAVKHDYDLSAIQKELTAMKAAKAKVGSASSSNLYAEANFGDPFQDYEESKKPKTKATKKTGKTAVAAAKQNEQTASKAIKLKSELDKMKVGKPPKKDEAARLRVPGTTQSQGSSIGPRGRTSSELVGLDYIFLSRIE